MFQIKALGLSVFNLTVFYAMSRYTLYCRADRPHNRYGSEEISFSYREPIPHCPVRTTLSTDYYIIKKLTPQLFLV
jgi:hypothetical protein